MMVAMTATYLALLFTLVCLGVIRFNTFWKMSPPIALLLLSIGLFIPMMPRQEAILNYINPF
jgi:hypothetical protein